MLVSTIINRGHYLAFFNRKKDGMVGCLLYLSWVREYFFCLKNGCESVFYLSKDKNITAILKALQSISYNIS